MARRGRRVANGQKARWIEFQREARNRRNAAGWEVVFNREWQHLSIRQRKAICASLDAYYLCANQVTEARQELAGNDNPPEKLALYEALIRALTGEAVAIRNLLHLQNLQGTQNGSVVYTRTLLVINLNYCEAMLEEGRRLNGVLMAAMMPRRGQQDGWVGGWWLGRGAFGQAVLFVQQDQHARVNDRLVVKSITMDDDWDDPLKWYGNIDRRYPLEVKAMENLYRPAHGSTNTVQCRGWRRPNNRQTFHIYMEFCPHSDLDKLIDFYAAGDTVAYPIPEPALWSLFEGMATSGMAMERFDLTTPAVDKKELIHRDIKPANVMLSTPDAEMFPAYPQVKIGDFGLSVVTSRNDAGNPRNFEICGTNGFLSPEQEMGGTRYSAWTNVWAIGMIMICLINLERAPDQLTYDPGTLKKPRVRPERAALYSEELLSLINACVRYHANRRPAFQDLLLDIQRFTAHPNLHNGNIALPGGDEALPPDRAAAMRHPQPGAAAGYPNQLDYPADHWAVNEMLARIPPLPDNAGMPQAPDTAPPQLLAPQNRVADI